MREELDFLTEDISETEGSEKRKGKKKKKKDITRAGIFLGGIIIGFCIMTVVVRFNQDRYDARVLAETVEGLASGEKMLTQEDIEEIRKNTDVDEEDIERLLASYDDDAQRARDRADGDDGVRRMEEVREVVFNDEAGEGEEALPAAGADAGAGAVDQPEPSGEEPGDTVSDDESAEDEKSAIGLLEQLKESLINGEGTMSALRKVFRDQIMVANGGRFYFFPISDELKHHDYDESALVVNPDGSLDYMKEDGTMAKKGVDVSRYQGAIDWEKVAAAGIDFAFIRLGYRGYGSGELALDETFLANATAASAQGIEIGVYFFSQAINEEEAVEEAQMVLDALGGNDIAYPVVFDLERVKGGRINNIDRDTLTDICLAFCSTIREGGYEPMIYGNLDSFLLMLDMKRLEDISKWFAYYNNDIYFPYAFDIWQYSSTGRVDGISGDVDMNISFR